MLITDATDSFSIIHETMVIIAVSFKGALENEGLHKLEQVTPRDSSAIALSFQGMHDLVQFLIE
jgi:hypothetical protein